MRRDDPHRFELPELAPLPASSKKHKAEKEQMKWLFELGLI
jgi:hypothetical protein